MYNYTYLRSCSPFSGPPCEFIVTYSYVVLLELHPYAHIVAISKAISDIMLSGQHNHTYSNGAVLLTPCRCVDTGSAVCVGGGGGMS